MLREIDHKVRSDKNPDKQDDMRMIMNRILSGLTRVVDSWCWNEDRDEPSEDGEDHGDPCDLELPSEQFDFAANACESTPGESRRSRKFRQVPKGCSKCCKWRTNALAKVGLEAGPAPMVEALPGPSHDSIAISS